MLLTKMTRMSSTAAPAAAPTMMGTRSSSGVRCFTQSAQSAVSTATWLPSASKSFI